MTEDRTIRYLLSFVHNGKVIEQHILDSEEQVQVFKSIAKAKGYVAEMFKYESSHKSSPAADNLRIIDEFPHPEKQEWCKTVRCVETGELFPSIREAARKYGILYKSIFNAIRSGNPRKGLHFVIHEGYTPEHIIAQKFRGNPQINRNRKRVLCITNGRVFSSVKEAIAEYKLSNKEFFSSIKQKTPTRSGLLFQYL